MQVPLFKIYWDNNDVERVTSVIKKGSYWAIGPEIKEFEKLCAAIFSSAGVHAGVGGHIRYYMDNYYDEAKNGGLAL